MARKLQIKLKSGEEITLTERERLFCEYYIGDANRNATQAALKAGYSQKTARNIATQNLSKLHIKKYIYDQTAPTLDALGATKERLLQEWASIGLSNIADFLEEDWSIKNLRDINPKVQGVIESVQVDEKVLMQGEEGQGAVLDRKIKFKLHDKIKALTMLTEIHGLVPEKKKDESEQVGQVNLFQQVNNYYESK